MTPHNDFFPSGLALRFLTLSLTFDILPSRRAASINFQKNTSTVVHLKEAEEEEVAKEMTYNRTSETCK